MPSMKKYRDDPERYKELVKNHPRVTSRDKMIVVDVLNGHSLRGVADYFNLSPARIQTLVCQMCERAEYTESVNGFHLSTRALNCFWMMNIKMDSKEKFLDYMGSHTDDELLRTNHFGHKTLKECRALEKELQS